MANRRNNDWKKRDGVVYSTSNDFSFSEQKEQEDTPPPQHQNLRVQLDKKSRGGKQVTLVTGFAGTEQDLKDLGKLLKTQCGVGGSAKDGEIIVQGDYRDRVLEILIQKGYPAKKSG